MAHNWFAFFYGIWSLGAGQIWRFFKFTKAIMAGEPINVYNFGRHRRDFTYIDDIVEGVMRVIDNPAVEK